MDILFIRQGNITVGQKILSLYISEYQQKGRRQKERRVLRLISIFFTLPKELKNLYYIHKPFSLHVYSIAIR